MRITLVGFIVLWLSGCAVQYKVVGKFDDFNEVFKGDVVSNLLVGRGQIDVSTEQSKIRCAGESYVTYLPPLGLCSGQRGKAPLRCSDGRRLEVDWVATSCTTGYGSGRDQNGATFEFVFGYDDKTADIKLTELRQTALTSPNLPAYRPREVRKEKGFSTGSGFFVTDDGLIITNYHVVEEAKRVVVVRPGDKTEIEAKVIQVDPANDVAILKIEAVTVPIPMIASSEAVRGQEILTLGYPLVAIQGQEQKATFGRINALTGIKDDVRLLQIDAPIQPGNSGSPLLNKRGEVIGVVTATLNSIVALRASGSLPQNVNFAVKSDYILPTLQAALRNSYSPSSALSAEQAMERIVALREASVVLVIAR